MEDDGDSVPALVCERKYVSDRVPACAVVALLRAWCVPDGLHPHGELESIYFDDPFLSSFREKTNGDALKRKVRIRWYRTGTSDGADRSAFLEIKDRIGAAREKARFQFEASVGDLERRTLGDPFFPALLREQARKAGFAIPPVLAPSVSIRYRRNRFVCPVTHSRVSVDYDIVCTRANPELLNGASHMSPMRVGLTICEAKSNSVRSWPFGASLARMGMRLESFSKYGYFVERILQGDFE